MTDDDIARDGEVERLRAESERLRNAIRALGEVCADTLVSDGDTTCTLDFWARKVLEAPA